jgi:eukaryotic-like serine/threonine-protein kinase
MSAELIAGRYVLGAQLGTGGMSTVRLAHDERLERDVAVKLLAEHLAQDEAFVARFRREALAAARLVHPNVVQVFDFGLDERSGRHYIVMEYVPGQSGAEILRDRGHLGVDETVEIVSQACRGLDYAHRNGVVHRDVKPGNLLRSREDVVKLADFGIAKAAEDSNITKVGSVLGTAAYLAPEQARGEEAGPSADLYALGVVTYQFLAGRLPYEATSLTELALKQQREPPPRLDALNRDVPPELADAVEAALALEPSGRYATALDMARALREGARGIAPATAATRIASATEATRVAPRTEEPRRVPREPIPPPRRAARPPAPVPAATRAPSRARQRRRNAVLFLSLLLLVAAAVAIAVVVSNNSGGVNLKPVNADNARDLIQQLRDLVESNVR